MALSSFCTLMLNRVTKRLWLSPLIVNAIIIIILLIMVYGSFISQEDASYAMYFIYMPIVFASRVVNLVVYFIYKFRGDKFGEEE